MRGSVYLVVDSVQNAHATRRQLVEKLNFPPTLAFSKGAAAPVVLRLATPRLARRVGGALAARPLQP